MQDQHAQIAMFQKSGKPAAAAESVFAALMRAVLMRPPGEAAAAMFDMILVMTVAQFFKYTQMSCSFSVFDMF